MATVNDANMDILSVREHPVIVEDTFDAIAVSIADPGRHAGLAPCGTALTSQQAAQLSQAADLPRTGIIVAFDSDTAGRKAAIRAHGLLRPLTGRLQSASLDGKDPAGPTWPAATGRWPPCWSR